MLLDSEYSSQTTDTNGDPIYKFQDEDEDEECLVINTTFPSQPDPIPPPTDNKENKEVKHAVKKSATKIIFDSSQPQFNENKEILDFSNEKMDLDQDSGNKTIKHAVKKCATKVVFEEGESQMNEGKQQKRKKKGERESFGISQQSEEKIGKKRGRKGKKDADINDPGKKQKTNKESASEPKSDGETDNNPDGLVLKVKGTKEHETVAHEESENPAAKENPSNSEVSVPQQENRPNPEDEEAILTKSTREIGALKVFDDKAAKKRSKVSKRPKIQPWLPRPYKKISKPQPKPPQEVPLVDKISALNQLKIGYMNKKKIAMAKLENIKGEYSQIKGENIQESQLRIFNEDIQLKMQNNEPGTLSDLCRRLKTFLRDNAQVGLNSYILKNNEDLYILFNKNEIPYDDLPNIVLNRSSIYREGDARKKAKLDPDTTKSDEVDYSFNPSKK
ncbi:unnamed protein product [Blepharisma stoltei]|uniref:Uncharacterized protein n=1 Tax=Blepharisma stoltei TaxID=1481888 RepID=A0AAU9K8C5_9CILI|nr:unnamed protein product [Blepharisma stoltei]